MNSRHAIMFTFGLIPLINVWTPLSTTVVLKGWLWHNITHKSWYTIKQKRNKLNQIMYMSFATLINNDCLISVIERIYPSGNCVETEPTVPEAIVKQSYSHVESIPFYTVAGDIMKRFIFFMGHSKKGDQL